MENISPSDLGFPHKVSCWRGHFEKNHKKLNENCKSSSFDKTFWGAYQFMRGDQPDFRVICSMQEKICSTKQYVFHE